jgi:hypothetical protein
MASCENQALQKIRRSSRAFFLYDEFFGGRFEQENLYVNFSLPRRSDNAFQQQQHGVR